MGNAHLDARLALTLSSLVTIWCHRHCLWRNFSSDRQSFSKHISSSYIFERHCLSGVDVVATTLQSYSSILRARNRHWTSLMLFLCWALPCVLGQRSWQISRVLAHNEARKGLTRCGFGLPFGKFSAAAAEESSLGEERPVISLANLSVFVCLRMILLFWVILIVFCLSGRHLVLFTAFRCTGRPGGFCQEGLWGFSRCLGSDGTDGSVGRSVVPVVETCKIH